MGNRRRQWSRLMQQTLKPLGENCPCLWPWICLCWKKNTSSILAHQEIDRQAPVSTKQMEFGRTGSAATAQNSPLTRSAPEVSAALGTQSHRQELSKHVRFGLSLKQAAGSHAFGFKAAFNCLLQRCQPVNHFLTFLLPN